MNSSPAPRWVPGGLAVAYQFIHLLISKFRADDCTRAAGTLTFTTLLSLVPLLAVTLGLLSAFPLAERLRDQVQDFIFANLVPTAAEAVEHHLQEFTGKAAVLTAPGVVMLLVTSVLLVSSISNVLNRIWRVQARKHWMSRLLVYWALLSLGPLLMAASLGLSSYVMSLPLLRGEALSGVQVWLLDAGPLLVTALAFTVLYLLVPDVRIRILPALAGGVVGALLFELAKRGFAFYLTRFHSYEMIYGALAALPIFLIWVHLSWVVILLGAEFAYCMASFSRLRAAGEERPALVLRYRLLGHVWQAHGRGRLLRPEDLCALESGADPGAVSLEIERLMDLGLLHSADDGGLGLTCNLDRVPPWRLVTELRDAAGDLRSESGHRDEWDRALVDLLGGMSQTLETGAHTSLGAMYALAPDAADAVVPEQRPAATELKRRAG